MASDKRGFSALRIAKHLGVSWITAQNMLRKIRKALADRDSVYRLENMIEFDDTLVGGKRAGKRSRRTEGKRPVLVAVETREKGAGFAAMHTVDSVSKVTVHQFFAKHLKAGQIVKTDALPGLNAVDETQDHRERVTPPEEAAVWLPLVHIMIGTMKHLSSVRFMVFLPIASRSISTNFVTALIGGSGNQNFHYVCSMHASLMCQ